MGQQSTNFKLQGEMCFGVFGRIDIGKGPTQFCNVILHGSTCKFAQNARQSFPAFRRGNPLTQWPSVNSLQQTGGIRLVFAFKPINHPIKFGHIASSKRIVYRLGNHS